MKQILNILGCNYFMAVKKQYNKCIDKNDFYCMLKRRLKYTNAKELAYELKRQLDIYFKEYTQFQ